MKHSGRFGDITDSQRRALAVATLVALLFGAYFLRHFFTLIVFAAILAFLFNPFYVRWRLKGRSPGQAAMMTFLAAAALILIPLLIVLVLTGLQISHSVSDASSQVDTVGISNFLQHIIDSVNHFLEKTPSSFRVTSQWIHTTAADLIQKAGNAILANIKTYVSSFFDFFTTAIIFIFVFVSLLKNQAAISETIRQLNPLGPEISDLYVNRIQAMTKAMVRGQFIIALSQGFTDAALIYIGGFHSAFFFLLLVLVVLSFVPLGGGILAIPIGIIMALTGNIAGGILVVAGHLILVTNIDNVLRPRLVPREAKLDSALTILSVFAGIALLGFLGIVVGPVIMIIIVTTINVYLEVYRQVEMKEASEEEPAGNKRAHWFRFWQHLRGRKK